MFNGNDLNLFIMLRNVTNDKIDEAIPEKNPCSNFKCISL